MRIKRFFDAPTIIYTEAGTSIVPVFELSEDETCVIEVGKKDIRKEVDSFRESTDINVILHHLSIGDYTMLARIKEGEFNSGENNYFDSTIFPQTLEEYHRMVQATTSYYNSIPEEIRSQFNGIDDFVGSSDDRIQSIIDSFYSTQSVPSDNVSEVKEGE